MVNCVTCKKAFRSRVGKGKETRCESCAKLWRDLQLREEDEGRKERNRELDIMERELELKQRQLEMERQKVTIKEVFPNGGVVEVTCYHDDSMQEKVRSLMKGAYLALPPSTNHERELTTDRPRRDYTSTYRHQDISNDLEDVPSYRRVHFQPEKSNSSELKKSAGLVNSEPAEYRKPRKLPSVDVIKSRITSRHRLEDEGSSFGSGGSAD